MRKLLSVAIALFITSTVIAQSAEKMTYQAVLRDGKDALAVNKNVELTLSIISQEDASETVFYREEHSSQTNSSGLVSLEIGSGSNITGSLSSIDWPNGNYSLKTNYVLEGINVAFETSTALNSSVYAFHANDAVQSRGFSVLSDVPTSSVFTDSQDASQVSIESTVLTSSHVQEAIEALQQSIETTGDMKTTVYDTQEDGSIDNALSINGLTVEALVPFEASFSDNQKASEVNLATAIDIDGDSINETTVELALNKLNDLLEDLWGQHDSRIILAADTEAEAIEENRPCLATHYDETTDLLSFITGTERRVAESEGQVLYVQGEPIAHTRNYCHYIYEQGTFAPSSYLARPYQVIQESLLHKTAHPSYDSQIEDADQTLICKDPGTNSWGTVENWGENEVCVYGVSFAKDDGTSVLDRGASMTYDIYLTSKKEIYVNAPHPELEAYIKTINEQIKTKEVQEQLNPAFTMVHGFLLKDYFALLQKNETIDRNIKLYVIRGLLDDHPESRDYLTEAFQEEELEEHKRILTGMLPLPTLGAAGAGELPFVFALPFVLGLGEATFEALNYQTEQLQEEDAEFNKSKIDELEEISQRNSQVDHFQTDQNEFREFIYNNSLYDFFTAEEFGLNNGTELNPEQTTDLIMASLAEEYDAWIQKCMKNQNNNMPMEQVDVDDGQDNGQGNNDQGNNDQGNNDQGNNDQQNNNNQEDVDHNQIEINILPEDIMFYLHRIYLNAENYNIPVNNIEGLVRNIFLLLRNNPGGDESFSLSQVERFIRYLSPLNDAGRQQLVNSYMQRYHPHNNEEGMVVNENFPGQNNNNVNYISESLNTLIESHSHFYHSAQIQVVFFSNGNSQLVLGHPIEFGVGSNYIEVPQQYSIQISGAHEINGFRQMANHENVNTVMNLNAIQAQDDEVIRYSPNNGMVENPNLPGQINNNDVADNNDVDDLNDNNCLLCYFCKEMCGSIADCCKYFAECCLTLEDCCENLCDTD
jgi:hypothetical protein